MGSALFNLLYVPLRLGLFLGLVAILCGLDLQAGGILPATVLMLVFLPFVWGVGLIAASAVLTFRRGAGAIGAGVAVFGLGSGAFFPLSVLPGWLASLAAYNPLAIALAALRDALIGGAGWHAVETPYDRALAAVDRKCGRRDLLLPALPSARAAARKPRPLLMAHRHGNAGRA